MARMTASGERSSPPMLGMLLRTLKETTRMCVAANLSLPEETVISKTIGDWRRFATPALKDQPAVFLLAA